MKKILYLLCFVISLQPAFSQGEQPGEIKVREKMIEYIRERLGLSRVEAEKFQPVFVEYFKDLKRANREFKGQGLELQQKIVEVRLRYRDQFKPIIGDKRSNDVFEHEKEFVQKIKQEINDRRHERKESRADKRKGTEL